LLPENYIFFILQRCDYRLTRTYFILYLPVSGINGALK